MKNFCKNCPVETTLSILENKWRVLIIRDLLNGEKRFGELKKSMEGISQRALSLNLRFMEKSKIINRKVFPEVPPHVEYSLTETGKSLEPILKEMEKWGNNYKEKHKEKTNL